MAGISGYPTQKKLNTPIVGVTSKVTTSEFATIQPSYSNKFSEDVIAYGYYRIHASAKTATSVSAALKRAFTSTAHGASIGDVVRFQTTASNPGFEAAILDVPDADTIVLSAETPSNITTGDTFFILRYVTPLLDNTGAAVLSSSSVVQTIPGANAAGSFSQATLTGTTAATITAPSNATGFILLAPSTNTHNIRWCIGATASTSNGMLTEPGRDTGVVPCIGAISVCAVTSGTNAYSIQWFLTS